ncbi:MAG: adenosine monophosphate-protein transferase [Candidatus Bathyarchaeota archaeon]|nr:MAG: adenosine monophosphate-protein transferase [Candidatus Bathyarchaeota archaeon]
MKHPMSKVNRLVIDVLNPDNKYQFILGMANFTIKCTEDILRVLTGSIPNISAGVAMVESAPRLVRSCGTDKRLEQLATENALRIGVGHSFVVMMENGFPINVLNDLKSVQEVCSILVATANPCKVIVAEIGRGSNKMRAILGVADGYSPSRVEDETEREDRRLLVRKLGYIVG